MIRIYNTNVFYCKSLLDAVNCTLYKKIISLFIIISKSVVTREYAASRLHALISNNTPLYGIMTEELVIREIRIDEAAGRGDSDSRMTSSSVIMPLKLQPTMKALL